MEGFSKPEIKTGPSDGTEKENLSNRAGKIEKAGENVVKMFEEGLSYVEERIKANNFTIDDRKVEYIN